jgi:hypothetical protein
LLAARAAQHSETGSEILTLARRFRYQVLTEARDACRCQG